MYKHGAALCRIPASNHFRPQVLDYQTTYTVLVQHIKILARMVTSYVKNNLLMPYLAHILC